MSSHFAKLFGRPLVLASAALVLHIGAATAADSTADIQQQLQGVLAGTSTTHSAPKSGLRDDKLTSTSADANAQEFVKQLLLGTTGSRVETIKHSDVAVASGGIESQKRAVTYSNAQAAAMRRVLLGQHDASDAS
jgi:hypothetical protein